MYINHVIGTLNELQTSGFKDPRRTPIHWGADYIDKNRAEITPRGVDIFALADGIVSNIFYDIWRGNVIDISHGNNIRTRYQHLRSGVKVKAGDVVKKGQTIAVMGNTGDCSSSNPNVPKEYAGTHLHLEVHVNGAPVDPEPYLTGAKSIDGSQAQAVPPANVEISVGGKVKVRQGATDFSGTPLKSFVYATVYDVMQIRRDGAVAIGLNGVVTAAMKRGDLIVV